jgi:AAA domain
MTASDFAFPAPLSFDDLARAEDGPPRWVWEGFVAGGAVTLLTSRWKAGKTTLLSVLLAKMAAGGALAGRAVAAGRAVVVSEEAPMLWAERGRRLGYGRHLAFLCRPFYAKPTPAEWAALIDQLVADVVRSGPGLVVIDPLTPVLPGPDENNATSMLAGLTPLRRLTAAGAAVLLLHHPRKSDGLPPGSGALPGFADVLLELGGPRAGSRDDRRRRLRAVGRFPDSQADVVIELNADRTDYAVVADVDPAAESFAAGWPVLRQVLEEAGRPLTRKEVLADWPEASPPPGLTQLWQWLDRAAAAGLVERTGAGRKWEPFRYSLPGRDDGTQEEDVMREEQAPLDGDIDLGPAKPAPQGNGRATRHG